MLCVFALAGCQEKDPLPELTVGQTEYTLGAIEGRTANVSFKTNVEWALSITYENTDTEWLTVTPARGTAGEQTIEVTADENYREELRIAHIDIQYGDKIQTLKVTQEKTPNLAPLFDPEFVRILKERGYISDEEKILPKDITGITKLDISETLDNCGPLTSLRGIEYFASLDTLNCANNRLTELDISKNTHLKFLSCSNNQLTTLDATNNTELTDLYCQHNQITELDINNNTELRHLFCYNNQLPVLDLSSNTLLAALHCQSNQLSTLEVGKNNALVDLHCSSNLLTALEVSKNTALKKLSCQNNQLTALDVTNNNELVDLSCYNNQLTTLDVSKNTALILLSCSNNQLTALDVTNNTDMTYLNCHNNQLTKLDISRNTELNYLLCNGNPGDGISVFPVTAWFGNDTIPSGFTKGEWIYGDKTIRIDYLKAE